MRITLHRTFVFMIVAMLFAQSALAETNDQKAGRLCGDAINALQAVEDAIFLADTARSVAEMQGATQSDLNAGDILAGEGHELDMTAFSYYNDATDDWIFGNPPNWTQIFSDFESAIENWGYSKLKYQQAKTAYDNWNQ